MTTVVRHKPERIEERAGVGRPKKKEKTSHFRAYASDCFKIAIVARVHNMDVADAFEHFFGKALDREYIRALAMADERKGRLRPESTP